MARCHAAIAAVAVIVVVTVVLAALVAVSYPYSTFISLSFYQDQDQNQNLMGSRSTIILVVADADCEQGLVVWRCVLAACAIVMISAVAMMIERRGNTQRMGSLIVVSMSTSAREGMEPVAPRVLIRRTNGHRGTAG